VARRSAHRLACRDSSNEQVDAYRCKSEPASEACPRLPTRKYAGLPYGSRVTVTIQGVTRMFAVAPARYSAPKRQWYLETLRNEGYVSVPATELAVAKYRRSTAMNR